MSIPADEVLASLNRAGKPVVLDVRSAEEYADGHVPGAINLPFLRVLAGGAPGVQRDAAVVVYCGHGPRAQMAMLGLQLRGFSNLTELEGHFAEWRRRGLPESRGAQP